MPEAVPYLNYDIVVGPPDNYGERKIAANPILGYKQFSVDEAAGEWLFRGKRFSWEHWGYYRPLPGFIRHQGRLAKEQFSPLNDKPEIIIFSASGAVVVDHSDCCECGGELRMDKNGYVYCEDCCIIYD